MTLLDPPAGRFLSPPVGAAKNIEFARQGIAPRDRGAVQEHRRWLASFLDGVVPGERSTLFTDALRKDPLRPLPEILQTLPKARQEQFWNKFPRSTWSSLVSLSQVSHDEIFLHGLENLSRRLLFDQHPESSYRLAGLVVQMVDVREQQGRLTGRLVNFRNSAKETLALHQGKGSFGKQAALFMNNLGAEVFDFWTLSGFVAGGAAFRLARTARLSKYVHGGAEVFSKALISPRLSASLWGIGAESTALMMVPKLGRHMTGQSQEWRPEVLLREWIATGVTMGSLRGTGHLFKSGFNRFFNISPFSGAAQRLPVMAQVARPVVTQLGMFSGIVGGHYALEAVGLPDHLTGENLLEQSLFTLIHFNLAGALAHRMMGPKFHQWQTGLDVQAEQISRQIKKTAQGTPPSVPLFPAPELALAGIPGNRSSPLEGARDFLIAMSMGSGGDGEKPNGGKLLHLPRPLGAPRRRRTAPSLEVSEVNLKQSSADAQEVEAFLAEFRHGLFDLQRMAEAHAKHRQSGRQGELALMGMSEHARGLVLLLRQSLPKMQEYHTQVSERLLSIGSGSDPVNGKLQGLRAQLKEILPHLAGCEKVADQVELAWRQNSAEEINRSISQLETVNHWLFKERGNADLWNSPQAFRVLGLEGMIYGLGVKEIFRPEGRVDRRGDLENPPMGEGELPVNSGRIMELANVGSFLRGLDSGKSDQALLEHLASWEYSPSNRNPRWVLNYGGNYQQPYRGWLGFYVPTLLAFEAGDYQRLQSRLMMVHRHMDPDLRAISPLSSWWLSQALSGRGEPHTWSEILPTEFRRNPRADRFMKSVAQLTAQSKINPGQMDQAFGTEGARPTLGHALINFLRYSQEPRLALERALEAPAPLREEVFNVTGSLLGAYHGRGAFPDSPIPKWYAQSLGARLEASGNSARKLLETQWRQISPGLLELRQAWLRPPRTEAIPNLHAFRPPGLSEAAFEVYADLKVKTEGIVARKVDETRGLGQWVAGVWRRFQAAGVRNLEVEATLELVGEQINATGDQIREIRGMIRDGRRVQRMQGESGEDPFGAFETTLRQLGKMQIHWGVVDGILSQQFFRGERDRPFPQHTVRMMEELGRLNDLQGLDPEVGLAPFTPRSYANSEIRALTAAAQLPGSLIRPLSSESTNLWGGRTPWAQAQSLVNSFGNVPREQISAEALFERYLELSGRKSFVEPNRSASRNISPGTLITVLTPAYLLLHRGNTLRAYQELEGLKISEDGQNREAWRGVTYLALRLLEGAPPNINLLIDTGMAFTRAFRSPARNDLHSPSPMGNRLKEYGTQSAANRAYGITYLAEHHQSKHPADQVLRGMSGFARNPLKLERALRETGDPELTKDSEFLARRTASLLMAAHRHGQGNKAPQTNAPVVEIRVKSDGLARRRGSAVSIPENWELFSTEIKPLHDLLVQWERSTAGNLSVRDLQNMERRLGEAPNYFLKRLATESPVNPELVKLLMLGLELVPADSKLGGDQILVDLWRQKSREVMDPAELQELSEQIISRYNYAAQGFYRDRINPDANQPEVMKERLADLCPLMIDTLAGGEMGDAQSMFILNRLGITNLPPPPSQYFPE